MTRSSFRRTRITAVALALLVASITTSVQGAAEAAPLTKAPKTQPTPSVDGKNFQRVAKKAENRPLASARGYQVADELPAATAAVPVELPAVAGETAAAPGTPVEVGVPRAGGRQVDGIDAASVRVLPRAVTQRADVGPLLFQVALEESIGSAKTNVPVEVDYSSFKDLYGGDWAARLQLVAVPDCALKSVVPDDCAEPTPLPTTNNSKTLTLRSTAPFSAGAQITTLAVAAAESSDQGDFAASPLQASSDWSVGTHTGNFSWTYKIPAVPVPSGLSPEVGINYSSQAVDGRTQASNNQTSWVGEGHTLETGFIERSYVGCADSQAPGSKTGDQCWKNDNATISFKGQSGALVRVPGTDEWRAKDDDGWRIRKLYDTTPGNGDNNGEYWEVTDQKGTKYYFGKERRFTGDTASTKSAWTVPVFGDDAGEPCHDTTFGSSWCQQAWRWNLDYVVDVHNNTMTYFYNQETNHYGLNNNATQPTYVAGGYLTKIEYGQVKGLEDEAPAAARTVFTTAERCLPDADFDCAPEKLTSANASRWPDVPFDRICDDEDSCKDTKSPAFFSRKRLVKVTSQVRNGASYDDVDRVELTQTFPQAGDGTGRSLWLSQIQRTGLTGGSLSTPPVKFGGVQMANRVEVDGAAELIKWRVNTITTEAGGTIVVTYSAPDCGTGNMPASPSSNTKRCFPAYWSQDDNAPPTRNWFHKYVVTAVTESDLNGTVVPKRTYYSYLGGGAWHYDDNELVKEKYRTWGEWRGYGTVEVRTGDPAESGTVQGYEKHLYLRGMDGDRLPDGSDAGDDPDRRDVTVTDAEGGTIADHDRFAGFERESITRNGETGPIVSAELSTPWLSDVTADDGKAKARILRTTTVKSRKQFIGTTNYRRSTVVTTYDSYGLPTLVEDQGDDAKSTDTICTDTIYGRNTDAWLIEPVKRTRTFNGACATTPVPSAILSDVRFSFDGQAYDAPPTKGDVTREEQLSGTIGAGTWVQTGAMEYDARGRSVKHTDGRGNIKTTQYVPSGEGAANLGPVSRTVVTNAKGHQTETWFVPGRGVPFRVEDANDHATTAAYDALGRVSQVWRPGRTQGVDAPTNKYTYALNNTTHSYLRTESLLRDGTYSSSYDIYDALLRLVETQAESPVTTAERVLTTTKYNSRGQTVQSLGPYKVAGAGPSGVYYEPSVVQVENNHKFTFDGAGRQTADIYQPKNDPALGWKTTTEYDADRTKVDPPTGGTPTTEITDVRGNITSRLEHLGASPAVTTTQALTYTYDNLNRMVQMTDPKANTWKWTFDLRGNPTKVVDPDKGTTLNAFDVSGNLTIVTDNRGQSIRNEYDELDRKITTYDGTAIDATKKRSAWEFDTVSKGQATRSVRYQKPGDTTTAFVTEVAGYDVRDRPLGTKTVVPAITGLTDTLAGEYTTTMTYHSDGTLKSKKLPAAYGLATEIVNYGYDRLGNPITLGGTDSIVGASTYSPFGEILQITTGTTSGKLAFNTWYYDEGTRRLNRQVVSNQAVTGSIVDATYGYDQDGNVTRIADVGGGADIQCFSYDFLGQVKEAWSMASGACGTPTQTVMGGAAPYWTSYTYDQLGNRTTKVEHPKAGSNTVHTYTYPTPGATAAPNGTTGVGGPHAVSSVARKVGTAAATTTAYKYDAAGNMTTRGTQKLTYDTEGNMTVSKDGTAADAAYVYGADGNRLLRREDNGTKTLYLDSTEIKLTGTTKTSQRWYQFGSLTVAARTSAGLVMLASDHHGTPQVQMGANAPASFTKRRFDPFGGTRTGTNPAAWSGDHGFLDKSVDKTTLTMVGARYYDNGIGRFITVDPMMALEDPQQVNAYAYAGNNPVTDADPTGTMLLDGGGGTRPRTTSTPIISQSSPVVSVVQNIAQAVASPLAYATAVSNAVLDNISKPLANYRPFFQRVAYPTKTMSRSIAATNFFRNRSGPGTHRAGGVHRGLSYLESRDWEKAGRILSNKWVRRAGVAGAVVSYGADVLSGPQGDDSMTTHVLKQTVKAGVVTGFASFGASLGAACGPAAAICGTATGTLFAIGGNWAGDLIIDSKYGDAAITWTADTVDSVGGTIADTISDIDLPDIDVPDIDMPDVSCCSNPFN